MVVSIRTPPEKKCSGPKISYAETGGVCGGSRVRGGNHRHADAQS